MNGGEKKLSEKNQTGRMRARRGCKLLTMKRNEKEVKEKIFSTERKDLKRKGRKK